MAYSWDVLPAVLAVVKPIKLLIKGYRKTKNIPRCVQGNKTTHLKSIKEEIAKGSLVKKGT